SAASRPAASRNSMRSSYPAGDAIRGTTIALPPSVTTGPHIALRRWVRRRATATSLLRLLAAAVAVFAIVLPLVGLFVASLKVKEVVVRAGDGTKAYRVAGHVVHDEDGVRFSVPPPDDPDGELIPVQMPESQVVGERSRWSLAHYEDVFGSPRTIGLLEHSL